MSKNSMVAAILWKQRIDMNIQVEPRITELGTKIMPIHVGNRKNDIKPG